VFALSVGIAVNLFTDWLGQRAPEIHAFINGHKLGTDTVLIFPTNTAAFELKLQLLNSGKIAANDAFASITTLAWATNIMHGKWEYHEFEQIGSSDPSRGRAVQFLERPIPPGFSGRFESLWLEPSKVEVFVGWLTFGATGADTKNVRVHIALEGSETNILRESQTASFFSRHDNAAVATNINLGVMQLLFDSTNEPKVFENYPGVRASKVTIAP